MTVAITTKDCPVAIIEARYMNHVDRFDEADRAHNHAACDLIHDQKHAMGNAALALEAASVPGALFQLGLVSSLLDFFSTDDESLRELMESALYSVAEVLMTLGWDDAGTSAGYFFPERCNPHRQVDAAT